MLHFASPASPADYLAHPIPTLKVGSLGTHNALGLAKAKDARFLLASTSEVYGDPEVHPQREDYWGNVNPIGPRGCYDEAKRFAEAITMAYHRYHGVKTRIVRIFNTYGPRMRLNDGRVLPAFMGQVLRGEPLTVFGKGDQTRSFCYVTDLVDGIYRLLHADFRRAGQHRQPVRDHGPGAGHARSWRWSPRPRAPSIYERPSRRTTPSGASPTSPGPRPSSAGTRPSTGPRASARTLEFFQDRPLNWPRPEACTQPDHLLEYVGRTPSGRAFAGAVLAGSRSDPMRILVVGGAGYIGSHTASLASWSSPATMSGPSTTSSLRPRALRPRGPRLDRRRPRRSERASSGRSARTGPRPSCTSRPSPRSPRASADPAKYYRNNVVGTLNLLDAMRAAGVGRFVFSSTAAVYGVAEDEPDPPRTAPKQADQPVRVHQAGHRAGPGRLRPRPTASATAVTPLLQRLRGLLRCRDHRRGPRARRPI